MTHTHHFTNQSCSLTLQQGLDQYYAENPDFAIGVDFLGQSPEIVKAHDVIHVVFGLGPSSAEELIVEMYTFFGSKFTKKDIQKIEKKNFIVELWKMFGPFRLMKRFILTIPRLMRTLYRIFRMKRRWPQFEYEAYLHMPLAQVREEFRIKVG